MTTALLDTEIVYSRLDKCYDIFVANTLVASAPTYGEAEAKRTQLLADRRAEGLYASATELDGAIPEEDDPPLPNEIPGTNPPRGPARPPLLNSPQPCDGGQYPCDKPATCTVITMDGNDMETARMVVLNYCDRCYDDLYDVTRFQIEPEPDPDPIPPWSNDPPNPGRAIGRMWHKQPRDFIAVLRQLDVTAWTTLAEAYAEWRGSDVTSVLDCWMLAVQGADVPANARS